MQAQETKEVGSDAIILMILDIAATATALALLESTRHASGLERIPRGVIPEKEAQALGELNAAERGRLATVLRGITRDGVSRPARWWRHMIDRVRDAAPSSCDPELGAPGSPDDALCTMTMISLYVELSVIALAMRRASPRRQTPELELDKHTAAALASMTNSERIALARALAADYATLPTHQPSCWWTERIEAARASVRRGHGRQRLAKRLSALCMN
ncbi:MAG: hypothetical protein J5I81_05375 [Nitrococcus mobilis]|nr:hypothetical protein [Nitrococcus mobilis]